MFSFLYSQEKKMRQNAANWLEVADRVYSFRRDQLTDVQNQRLVGATTAVKLRLKEKADVSKLKLAVEALEGVLRDTGGKIYPQSSLVENVEFFLVAAIVILGLRAYFIQPFKIPTNSMWPSYYGMTSEVFKPGEQPGVLGKAARLATLGASNYTLTAPADGEVMIPVFGNGIAAYTEKPGRTMWVFPALMREYTLAVGGQPVRVTAPADWAQSTDFGFEDVMGRTFFGGDRTGIYRAFEAARGARQLESSTMQVTLGARSGETRVYWVPTGKMVRKGDPIMSFDVLTGDLLFVDRFTYNFIAPGVGSGFVFRTGNIKSPVIQTATGGVSQYYVKRLVGTPGDTIEIKEPVLYRNGKPIEGSDAFGKNARREGLYPGYRNNTAGPVLGDGVQASDGMLPLGGKVTVPAHSYFALGDNSPNSLDSRFWGFVPDKEVVGRPLFIYFPLTSRWGPAR
ncbi:signal peptidase I [Opitutus sp. GAS368]|uniref:signal peptidase I n=1 Tax=Opitutus sp. GAS368 TaxID=1882749 RepID=UPI00087CA37C|nr:signal peptidase I [Opitutus sp. GAS368]SDS57519.1 signal peptidase I [Opitutus sp. GAS368]